MLNKNFKEENLSIHVTLNDVEISKQKGTEATLKLSDIETRIFIPDSEFNKIISEGLYGLIYSTSSEDQQKLLDRNLGDIQLNPILFSERKDEISAKKFDIMQLRILKEDEDFRLFQRARYSYSLLVIYNRLYKKIDMEYTNKIKDIYKKSKNTREYLTNYLKYIENRKQTVAAAAFAKFIHEYCSEWLLWASDKYVKNKIGTGILIIENSSRRIIVDHSTIYLLLIIMIFVILFFVIRFMRREKEGFLCSKIK